MEYGLASQEKISSKFNNRMYLQKEGKTKIGYLFRPCRNEISLLKFSFFEASKSNCQNYRNFCTIGHIKPVYIKTYVGKY